MRRLPVYLVIDVSDALWGNGEDFDIACARG